MGRYFVLHTPKQKKGQPADLGPSIFYDPSSKLKILSRDSANPDPVGGFDGKETKKLLSALKNNHIKEVTGFDESKRPSAKVETPAPVEPAKTPSKDESPKTAEDFDKMTDEELLKYYKEEFETTKEERASFKAMSKEKKIEFLLQP